MYARAVPFRPAVLFALASAGVLVCGCSGGGADGGGGGLPPPASPFSVTPLSAPLQATDLAGEWYGYERATQYSNGSLFGPSAVDAMLTFDAGGGPTRLYGFFFDVQPSVTIADAATGRLRIEGSDGQESRIYDVHVQEFGGRRTIRGTWTSSEGSGGIVETHRLAPLATALTAADLVGNWTGTATRFGASTATPITFTVASGGGVTGGTFEGFALRGNSISGLDAYATIAPLGIANVGLRSGDRFPDGREKYFILDLVVDPQTRTASGFFGSEIIVSGTQATHGDVGGYVQLSR